MLADKALVFLERQAMGLARLEGPRQAPGPRRVTGRRFGRRSHGGSRRWSIRCKVASRGDRLPQSKCTTFATPQHGAARDGDTLRSLFYGVAPFLQLSGRRLYKLGLTSKDASCRKERVASRMGGNPLPCFAGVLWRDGEENQAESSVLA